MTRTVSATQAAREFPKLRKLVEAGEVIFVTRYGKPYIKMIPFIDESDTDRGERARAASAAKG